MRITVKTCKCAIIFYASFLYLFYSLYSVMDCPSSVHQQQKTSPAPHQPQLMPATMNHFSSSQTAYQSSNVNQYIPQNWGSIGTQVIHGTKQVSPLNRTSFSKPKSSIVSYLSSTFHPDGRHSIYTRIYTTSLCYESQVLDILLLVESLDHV